MIIRVKRTWKDLLDNRPAHKGLTRRDFIEAGLLTGVLAVGLPRTLIESARADASACPPPVRNGGALAQIFMDGGWTGASAIMSNTMAGIASTSTNAQANYGIDPASLQQVGDNFVVASNNAFGATLLAGMPGIPQATWTQILKNTSMCSIHGPWNQDDGGMSENQKKGSGLGKSSAM